MPFQLRYPIENPRITQYFLERPEVYGRFNLPGHEGIDFGAPVGTPVLAAADGTVDAVEPDASKHAYGKYIRLRHKTPDGTFTTIYGHLSDILVTKDQKVTAGDRIGLSGNTGFSEGPHLHFSLKMPGVAAKGLTRFDDLINNRQNVLFLDDFLDPAWFFGPPPPKQSTTPRVPIPFAPLFAPAQPDAPPAQPAPPPPQPIGEREPVPAPPPKPEPPVPVMPVAPVTTVVVPPADTGPIQRPDYPLRGLHGDNAAQWMLQNGVRGWAVETVYANGDLSTPRPVDFSAHEAAGIRVLVRWNYSYASSDG
ncbi:MAG TPA: M23 family metallopeptidase, partial [Candidatus Limnocylindrales bacterium]|nr:M23 family metallopeptidase [Candidatus Limnocylindrales bacterium]